MSRVLFVVALATFVVAAPTKKKPAPEYVVVVTNTSSPDPIYSATSTEALLKEKQTPNTLNESFPILKGGQFYIKGNEYGVIPPKVVDPDNKNVHGVDPAVAMFNVRDPTRHPMEDKTPLYDFTPCSKEMILDVKVQGLEYTEGVSFPTLPTQYGCTKENEISREKASPAVRWSNFTAPEIADFSLQLISMGDEKCTGEGVEGYNRIHWHVTGIHHEGKDNVTLQEGASHDKRLLFGGKEQPNQWLEEYYAGPCPPPGVVECFRFKVLGHLHDGKTCVCGFQDVLFSRPVKVKEPIPWAYKEPTMAPIGKRAKKVSV